MKQKELLSIALWLIFGGCLFASCSKDGFEETTPPKGTIVTEGVDTDYIKGLFLLNEANMGSNKVTLDYFDYRTGAYQKNIYAERNPGVVNELGDVGNDIQIYRDKLYCVINGSNLVEVMDVNTAKHIAAISIPNCRYIVFKDDYAYVSSYAGSIPEGSNSQIGSVVKVDLADFKIVTQCLVGRQPNGMAIVDDKLYVANSGGYTAEDYDDTVSVIDLKTFTETKKIEVAVNLNGIESDNYGNIYISSRGNYADIPSKTFILDTKTHEVSDELNPLPNSNMTICGDSLYLYSTEWNSTTNANSISYAIVNTKTKTVVTRNIIKDGTEKKIIAPYGIAVNPETREFFVTDAVDYITPGTLYCFDIKGTKKWEVKTGDIPAHMVFTDRELK